ncbi:cyclophilin-like fold protein [Streptomyces sp. NPDC052016]|uniref:cyclophilin-like fold protein n=1 Tax=Streptomyces sp. NPDC052016 TaxID=3365680 RepID=UPI0037D4D340
MTRIRLTTGGRYVDATLNDGAAARDFATLLPLTLELEDFHRTERIGYPPRKLDTSGAPEAATPKAGDLAYYAPWGNLALFYRDGEHSPGLVILGRLDATRDDIERLATATRVRMEGVP